METYLLNAHLIVNENTFWLQSVGVCNMTVLLGETLGVDTRDYQNVIETQSKMNPTTLPFVKS